MAKQRRIVPPPAVKKTPKTRSVSLDRKCKVILHLYAVLHGKYGKDAVIKPYANPKDKKDGVGWFEVRGVDDPKTGRPKKFHVTWADPRRRTESMAHMGLFEWIDKNIPKTCGFRLNDDGWDFFHGQAAVRKTTYFNGAYIGVVRQKGPLATINDITGELGDREWTGVDD